MGSREGAKAMTERPRCQRCQSRLPLGMDGRCAYCAATRVPRWQQKPRDAMPHGHQAEADMPLDTELAAWIEAIEAARERAGYKDAPANRKG